MSNESSTPKKSNGFYTWSPVFLEALTDVPNISRAARIAGIHRTTAYKHRESNSAFADAWDAAIEVGVDRLEEEMWRRAVEGTDKPIVHRGEVVQTYKEYSDTLAIFLAKAHRPEKFRDRVDVKHEGEAHLTVEFVNDWRRHSADD